MLMGALLCEHCTGLCCKYIALPIDPPENKRDFDDMRWYLLHRGILIFVEDGDWYIQIEARCDMLTADNRCRAYDTRPRICREYAMDGCDYHGGDYEYDHLFTTQEQLEAFAKDHLGGAKKKRKSKKRKSKKKARKGISHKKQLRSAG